jgi:predicted metal-dependent hydrolase
VLPQLENGTYTHKYLSANNRGGIDCHDSDMRDALTAGIAVYNAGEHHAAHDAWEERWLDLETGTEDERFLHGLIQFTAVVYHGRRRNWSGARKLARSAGEYLADLDADHRGVDLDTVRRYLDRIAVDPEYAERAPPPALRYDGERLTAVDLSLDALDVAAAVLAAEYGFDEDVLADAVRYAREEERTARTRFRALVIDFVRETERRGLVYTRLHDHVQKRRREATDVEGLFD